MKIKELFQNPKFPIELFDSNGNRIYYENSSGYWSKREYDSNRNRIYYEDSTGYWVKQEYDSNGKLIYSEDSRGYWVKLEYDSNGNQIYSENSNGKIIDKRPKVELTLDQIAKKFGIPINQLKIKK